MPRKRAAAFGGQKRKKSILILHWRHANDIKPSAHQDADRLDQLDLDRHARQGTAYHARAFVRGHDLKKRSYHHGSFSHSLKTFMDKPFQAYRKRPLFLAGNRQTMVQPDTAHIAGSAVALCIEDFITPRASKKEPSVVFYFDHAKKPNRPRFLWGQMRVSLSVIGLKNQKAVALPLLLRLMRTVGNSGKLDAAWLLMKVLLHWKPTNVPATVLLDAW